MTMQRIVCLGDSITHAKGLPEGRRWTAVLQHELDALAPGKYEIYNRGIGGNITSQALDRFDVDVKGFLPSIVLIQFGFNDASVVPGRMIPRCGLPAFETNLREIARLVKAGKGKAIFLTNHPIAVNDSLAQGNSRSYHQNFKPYQPVIRNVAAALKLPLIDLEAAMGKAGVKPSQIVSGDGLHLTTEGHRIYASYVLEGLKPILKLR